MGRARISKRVNCSTSANSAVEDNREFKLLKLYRITCAAQLKLRKLTRREILENTKSDWFIRDPAVSHNDSKHTMHVCPFTNCEFQGNKIRMKLHTFRSHPTIMPYKCVEPGCKYVYNQHGFLINHMRQSHSMLCPQFACSYSGCDFKARYKPNYKNRLIKVHNEKPHACETCQKAFKTMHKLKCHLMTHTREKPHKCPHCAWRARQAGHLQLHEDPSTRAKFRIYKCTFKGCTFSSNQNGHLKSHMTTHTEKKPFKCTWPKCSFASRSVSELNRHMKNHSKDKLYICNFCSSAYTTNEMLTVHMRSHTGEKPYKCSYRNCGYATAEAGKFKRHLKVRLCDKIRKRSLTCGFCQESFFKKSALESHIRTHTEERPYSCQYCTRDFREKCVANFHERRCKMRTDGKVMKPFKCQFCERAFVTKEAERGHERCCKMRDDWKIIKPHKCQYCSKEFTWRESLKCHERCCSSRPDGIIIKPFKCLHQNCNYAATWRNNLKQHNKIHLLVE